MKKDNTFYDLYCAYKVTTTSEGIRALWKWLGLRVDVPLEFREAKIVMADAWTFLDDHLIYEMLDRGETIFMVNTDTSEVRDVYDWLWERGAHQQLMQFFPYDFLDDMRAMPEDEFKELMELFW